MPAAPQPGETLAGKYRVERVIGEGGMGIVVAATHIGLDERVAIKLLSPTLTQSPQVCQRFLREARAAVKIRSEHVARVFDVGTIDDGQPYMVMEHLEGSDLAALLEASGPLQPEVAAEYVLQACEALAEAHSLGIVHRDLKPGNVFLARRADGSPLVKVLDFGISKMSGASDAAMTKTHATIGSPVYMSPEQLESARDVDARADVWSLGVMLFELVTKAAPFVGETLPQLCVMIREAPAPRLRSVAPGAPAALEAVVARCLEKDRGKRFASVGELASALAPIAPERARVHAERAARVSAGRSSEASSMPAPAAEDRASAPGAKRATQATWGKTSPAPAERSKAGFATATAIGVAVIAVGIAVASSLRHAPAPPTASGIAPSMPSLAPRAVATDATSLATPAPPPATPLPPATPSANASAVARIAAPIRVAHPAAPRTPASATPAPPPAPSATGLPRLPDDRN